MVLVNLAELPLEILEQIVAELDPDEISASVSQISKRFAEVAYNVLCKEFRTLEPLINRHLADAKEKLETMNNSTTSFENEMIQVSNFTFYQVLQSEYKLICAVYFKNKSLNHSSLVFQGVRNLKEFAKLLYSQAEVNLQEDNVSSILDTLRSANSELLEYFFLQVWNLEQDYMGLLILKFLNCSLCSNYDVEISYEQSPKYKNSKCHIKGKYEIVDLSNTLSSPPGGLQEMTAEKAKRSLTAYICDAIRWGNLFHTLRLRWICMDRALAMGRRQSAGWPRTDPRHPYVSDSDRVSVQETLQEMRNGENKVVRRIKKDPDPLYSQPPIWMGTRVEFQLWCRANEAPSELFSPEYWQALQELPGVEGEDDPNCTWPYHFKMEYKVWEVKLAYGMDHDPHFMFVPKAYVRAMSNQLQGLIESTVWVKESSQKTTITQSKQLLTT